MNQDILSNILTFLDRAAVTGHKERMIMNECVQAIVEAGEAMERDKAPAPAPAPVQED